MSPAAQPRHLHHHPRTSWDPGTAQKEHSTHHSQITQEPPTHDPNRPTGYAHHREQGLGALWHCLLFQAPSEPSSSWLETPLSLL